MCLLPGMLERAPARPSERALRLATTMMVLVGLFALFSLLLIISYSVWSVVQNLLFAVYCTAVLYPFRRENPLVFVENVACFCIISSLNGLLSVFNLVSLATEKQAFYEKLANWQIITGIVMSSLCVACYCLLGLVGWYLFRDLRETVIQLDEEANPFIPGSNPFAGSSFRGEQGSSSAGFGSFGYPPVGSYVQTQTMNRSSLEQEQRENQAQSHPVDRFPGKGYKLGS